MIVDGEAVEDGHVFEADVCVIGSGAAGLPLALALADRGVDVLLVESGGLRHERETQKLLDVEMSGEPYPIRMARERFFGGTTNHWGGMCRPFDPFEFEPHPWVPLSGWPIRRSDLDPYYERARPLLGLPHPHYDYDPVEKGVPGKPPLLGTSASGFVTTVWRRTQPRPVRLGRKYRQEVARSERIRCVLNATVSELLPTEGLEHVREAEARVPNGNRVKLRARDFVLCAGAIENARLLLLSDAKAPEGLGNAHGWVGRCFMDHPGRVLGQVVLLGRPDAPTQEEAILRAGGFGPTTDLLGWSSTPAIRREKRLQGFMAFGAVRSLDPEKHPEAAAIRDLAGASGAGGPIRALGLWTNYEQSPNPESRVTLSTETDALGIRKPALHWALREDDLARAEVSARLFAAAIAGAGHARMRLDGLRDPITIGAGHQMGTTRMAEDPTQGVIDRDCRVHGIENLFVAGGSVFATGGWQHPTLTIVALALRLADHLVERARSRRSALKGAEGPTPERLSPGAGPYRA